MTTLEDFIDTSDIDFEPPPELREQINETLVELNLDLYGQDGGIGNPPKLIGIDVINQSGATCEFKAVANDAEDTDSKLSYEWQVDRTLVGYGSNVYTFAR